MSGFELTGAVDLHVHSSPDVRPRRTDSWESAELAVAAGMGGIALKNHQYCTAAVAAVLRPRFPGLRVLSYLVMNRIAGGFGLDTVRLAIGLGVDIVSFPTLDSVHHLASGGKDVSAGIPVSEGGELTEAAKQVIEEVVEADRVIATGHSAPNDSLLIARHAHAVGGRRILITHVTSARISMPIEMQREAASLGAKVEHAYESTRAHMEHPTPIAEVAAQITELGAQHCVLTTDFGQLVNPPFTDGLRSFAEELMTLGIPSADIQSMITDQPTALVAA